MISYSSLLLHYGDLFGNPNCTIFVTKLSFLSMKLGFLSNKGVTC